VCRLQQLVSKTLPNTIPVATPNDKLARFANATACDDPGLASDDLWEEVLNPFLKEVTSPYMETHSERKIDGKSYA
jgi:hypothetical protein